MNLTTDVLIVGAGPAGLFAAYELATVTLEKKLSIAIIDKGKNVSERVLREDITQGIGGTGLFSDGKLILSPYVGGNLRELIGVRKTAELIEYVDKIFVENGVNSHAVIPPMNRFADQFLKTASTLGVEWMRYPVRHIGTENNPVIIKNIKSRLEKRGVRIFPNTKAEEIITYEGSVKAVKAKFATQELAIHCKYVILALGKSGASWLSNQAKKLWLRITHTPIDIGVRVEVPIKTLEPLTSLCKDIKLRFKVEPYKDLVRTFCVCKGGRVIIEIQRNLVMVNGHSYKHMTTKTTNFGLLVTLPVRGDSLLIAQALGRLVNLVGSGKPVVQRLDDFMKRKRSSWQDIKKSEVKLTLSDVVPHDITSIYPYRLVVDLSKGLEKLIALFPNLRKESTMLYAPELTSYPKKVETNKHLETKIQGLYVAGDGAGISHGIVQSAASGILVARSIIRNLEKERERA